MGGYVAHETRTSVRYFLGAIPLPYLLKITPVPISHTNSPPTNRITKPFTRGGEYLHPPLKTPYIITHPCPITVSFPIYIQITIHHLPPLITTTNLSINTTYLPKNNRTLYRKTY